jgi:NACHT domain-containing protein
VPAVCQPSVMKKRLGGWNPSRRTGRITAALLLGTTATVLILARVYNLGMPAIMVAVLIALPGLWLAWVPYQDDRRRREREINLHDLSDQLARAVGRQWESEARIRRLNDPYPLPVSWSAADSALTDDWAVIEALASAGAGRPATADYPAWAKAPADLAGQGDGLAAVLTRVPTRRLVVLGEPGAGKTMLMVRLVLDLLASRQAGMAVPFLVPVASWNPLSQGLHQWLAARLTDNHSALTAAYGDGTQAQALLEAGLILPLLDGLDEIPEAIRGPAIAEINNALRPGEAMILTCRTEDYRKTVRPSDGLEVTLRAAAGILLNPLRPDVVGSYLLTDAGGPKAQERWAPVMDALGSAAPVAQALTTPLMVSLARVIYNPRPGEMVGQLQDPAELCGANLADRAAVEAHLLDAFVPAAYRDLRSHLQAIHQAERWLRFLAAYLDSGIGGTDIAWWQIRQITPFAKYANIAKAARKRPSIPSPARSLGIERRVLANVIQGAIIGAIAGWVAALVANNKAVNQGMWPPSSTRDCIGGALIGALAFAIGGMLKAVPSDINTAASPQAILRRDRRTFWGLLIWIALSVGFIIGVGALLLGTPFGRFFWIGGFCTGILAGCASGSSAAAWFPYKSAHLWLARYNQLPRALMGFLEDAHRRGVLRQAGAVYQFRHIELQHRLAERYEEAAWFQEKAKAAFLSSVVTALSDETPATQRAAGLNQVIAAAQARRRPRIGQEMPGMPEESSPGSGL